jgi:hypothetical protein
MKNLILTLLFSLFLTQLLSGQCNVTVSKNSQGLTLFTAQKEEVYKDLRFESGILSASIQLTRFIHT